MMLEIPSTNATQKSHLGTDESKSELDQMCTLSMFDQNYSHIVNESEKECSWETVSSKKKS